jgi:hypothetical protein
MAEVVDFWEAWFDRQIGLIRAECRRLYQEVIELNNRIDRMEKGKWLDLC